MQVDYEHRIWKEHDGYDYVQIGNAVFHARIRRMDQVQDQDQAQVQMQNTFDLNLYPDIWMEVETQTLDFVENLASG